METNVNANHGMDQSGEMVNLQVAESSNSKSERQSFATVVRFRRFGGNTLSMLVISSDQ